MALRLAARNALAPALVLLLATCSSPTEPPPLGGTPTPPPGGEPPPSPMTELVLTFPGQLLVRESALLTVTGRTAEGDPVTPPYRILYRSSNDGIARVSSEGVVVGVNRGSVTILASSGNVQGSVTVAVRARLTVTLAQGFGLSDYQIAVALDYDDSRRREAVAVRRRSNGSRSGSRFDVGAERGGRRFQDGPTGSGSDYLGGLPAAEWRGHRRDTGAVLVRSRRLHGLLRPLSGAIRPPAPGQVRGR